RQRHSGGDDRPMGIRSRRSDIGALPPRADVPARRRPAPVMMRTARLICALFAVSVSGSACAGTDAPDDTAGAVPGDTAAAADTSSAIDAADAGPEGWQTANGITYRQNRTIDLTGDGRN